MCRNSPTSVIIAQLLPDFTSCYLCASTTSVTPPAHRHQASDPPFSLALPWLSSKEDLSLPIWIHNQVDKLNRRSINVSFCMGCTVIVLMWQHRVAIGLLFFFLSDVSLPEVSHSFPHSMFAHMIRFKVFVCVRAVHQCHWETAVLSFSATKCFPRKLSCETFSSRLTSIADCVFSLTINHSASGNAQIWEESSGAGPYNNSVTLQPGS